MDVRQEINLHAAEADKAILRWLFARYHMASQWHFVATCTHRRHGVLSYETHRVWEPTAEGRVLFAHMRTN
jgi:hypothetical protein